MNNSSFYFALKSTTGGKSKDRSKSLEDLDEAEQGLEWLEVNLEGRQSSEGKEEKSRKGPCIPAHLCAKCNQDSLQNPDPSRKPSDMSNHHNSLEIRF